jgi:protein gp138
VPIQRSLPEILRAHADAIKSEIRKCLPGTVTAVDANHQTVDVQLAVNGVLFDELGTAVSVPAPSLSGVPLGVLRGGGFLVWVPVAVGDSVLVMFSDLSCDVWSAGPVGNSAVDPGWVGQHTHDSPFAIPMVSPAAGVLTSTPTNKVVIGKDNADEQILIGPSDIELGRGATAFVALSTKIDLFIQTVMAWIPASGDGGAALKTALTGAGFTTATSTAATLVKAQ